MCRFRELGGRSIATDGRVFSERLGYPVSYGESRRKRKPQAFSVDLICLDPPFNSQQAYNVIFAEDNGTGSSPQMEVSLRKSAPAHIEARQGATCNSPPRRTPMSGATPQAIRWSRAASGRGRMASPGARKLRPLFRAPSSSRVAACRHEGRAAFPSVVRPDRRARMRPGS